jgi:hypothetical protein
MNLKPNEVCELLKGAYGLINAPLLWYCELKAALLSLGFIVSPMDPCLFVLLKNKSDDDSPNGGDATFSQAIQKLEKRFPFGSQRTGNFTFTGIHIHQDHNGDISLDQQDYINDIPPIDIPRERRKTPEAKINNEELQKLRGLIGSLQYAATNTRPDLSCKLSLLQARVTCATINDLLQGNRILNEAERFSETAISVQALPLQELRFLSFSDAAFATREKAHSQKGCVILATTETIDKTQSALVSPLLWFSKKINRVVSSTLASETFALSGALDLLSWTRVHWAWLLNPNLEWKNPEATLKKLPSAFAVVDCKSLFDLLQKTSVPQCSEYRTMLEALVVKERLKEGVIIKWVHSAAQMADSLTKDMDTTVPCCVHSSLRENVFFTMWMKYSNREPIRRLGNSGTRPPATVPWSLLCMFLLVFWIYLMEQNRFRSASCSAKPSAVLRDPGCTNETGNPRTKLWRSKNFFCLPPCPRLQVRMINFVFNLS